MSRRHAPRHSAARGAHRTWALLAAAGTCLVLAGAVALGLGDDGAPDGPTSTPRTQQPTGSPSDGGSLPSPSTELPSPSPSSTTPGTTTTAGPDRTGGSVPSRTSAPTSSPDPEPSPVRTTAPAPSTATDTKRPKPTPPGFTNRPTKTPR